MLCQPFQQLYSGNQNVYFLWGMAKAGIGSLGIDPLLAQTDPYPLFSLLVMVIAGAGLPWLFHVVYWALCSVYTYSVFGMGHHVFDLYGRPLKLAVFSSIFLLLHSGGIWSGLFRALAGIDLLGIWDHGMAGQSVLQGYLQPSAAGVFLVLSAYHYLRQQPAGVFLSLAVSAIVHANYMFLGTGMGVVYLLLFVTRSRVRMAPYIAWAGLSVLIVMPQLLYVATFFLPHGDEEAQMLTEAVALTAVNNIHLDPSLWLDLPTAMKAMVLLAAIVLWFRTPLGNLLLGLTLFSGAMGALAFAADSQTLLSLTPWRMSVVLVPVSVMAVTGRLLLPGHHPEQHGRTLTVLLGGCVLLVSFGWFRVFGYDDAEFMSLWRWKTVIGVALALGIGLIPLRLLRNKYVTAPLTAITMIGVVATGMLGQKMEQRFQSDRPEQGVTGFLRAHAVHEELVLMPTDLASLRMNASVGVVADDHLVHGLHLPQLLERQRLVRTFYTEGQTAAAWHDLTDDFAITSVIIPASMKIPTDLPLGEVYRDEHYAILRPLRYE